MIDKKLEQETLQQKEERLRQWEQLEKCEREVLEELAPYGIKRIYNSKGRYPPDDFYALKFIIYFLDKPKELPKLEALLATCSDDDLLYKGTNALMWAADAELAYEKLLLLADRKDFIATHIMGREPDGRTVLHRYASRKFAPAEGVKLLLDWGADVNAIDDELWTPLHDAARSQNDSVYGELEKYGAVSTRNSSGDSPMTISERLYALDLW
ncbi:MAG: ankyrin repeat domain-containing protein [Coriobacteriia bacterium]|nr:ankyrin repeat domain-containing protein [Coriobacteriia bacterium]